MPLGNQRCVVCINVKRSIRIFLHLGIFNAERDPFLLQELSLHTNKQAVSRIPLHHLYPPTISIKVQVTQKMVSG